MPKLYRFYYCLYYYLIGFWIIVFPIPIKLSVNKIVCKPHFDSKLKGFTHHNFLFFKHKNIVENKWLFWQRKFAFRIVGTDNWYLLPSLTMQNIYHDKAKYGLNSTFVRKWSENELEFYTWK